MPLELSANTRHALRHARPDLRGLSHLIAAVVSVPAGVWLAAVAPAGRPRLAAAVFAASITVMFAVSATLHRREWSPRGYEVMFRLDHTGIFLAFAGSATPIALLGLDGWHSSVLLWGMWGAAVVGAAVEWLPFRNPRGMATTIYLTLGWLTVVFLPPLQANRGWGPITLLLGGGVLYTIGAIIVGLRRPDPAPKTFGYHEIFHLLVIGAVGLHYAFVVSLLPG